MQLVEVRSLLHEAKAFPPVPPIAAQVARMVEEDSTTAKSLGNVIGRDPALAARLLRLANSAFYGFCRRVDSLPHGVALLGLRTVKNLVLSLSLKSLYRTYGAAERRLWEHSVGMAAGSCLIAREVNRRLSEGAFVAGLLADAGQVLLMQYAPRDYPVLLLEWQTSQADIRSMEIDRFGFGHEEVGALLAREWNIPETLENTILYHHRPEECECTNEVRVLANLVKLSDLLCSGCGIGRSAPQENAAAESEEPMRSLGLDPARYMELSAKVLSAYEESGRLLA